MKTIDFVKYHGTGNDFILVDARRFEDVDTLFDATLVQLMCQRRFGIGADGLILIREKEGFDFHMDYFNADGRRSSMCGNGSRCAMHYARTLGMIGNAATFYAPDGSHIGHFEGEVVAIKMNAGSPHRLDDGAFVIETGSPHYVQFVDSIAKVDVNVQGREVRNRDAYLKEGINVNFVEAIDDENIVVATYERGVEEETLSCGTGVTACALIHLSNQGNLSGRIEVRTKGGSLSVDSGDLGVWLIGPVQFVYSGKYFV